MNYIVVYYNQLSIAAHTWKLIEMIFGHLNFFFSIFLEFFFIGWWEEKVMQKNQVLVTP